MTEVHIGELSEQGADGNFDVCVCGTGPAGITLAMRLIERGHSVLLLEGGSRAFTEVSQSIYKGRNVGLDYFDLDVTRLRYFGGTSNHWQGMCRPFDAHDFEARAHHPLSGWPIRKSELDPYASEVETILEIPTGPWEGVPWAAEEGLQKIAFRFSPPVRFAEKYGPRLLRSSRAFVVLDANVVDIRLTRGLSHVDHLLCRSLMDPGVTRQVRSRFFVLCLGGLENPRILLNCNRQIAPGIGNERGKVGRYFCEHPHFTLGEVVFFRDPGEEFQFFSPTAGFITKWKVLNFGLRLHFDREREKNPLREAVRSALCAMPPAKRMLDTVRGRSLRCYEDGLVDAVREWVGIAPMAGRLRIAAEQALNPESRVLLTRETDRLGLRRIALDCRLTEMDYRTLQRAAERFAMAFARRELGRIRLRKWVYEPRAPLPTVAEDEVGGNHHMCTTRMAAAPEEGVVDRDCRVFGIDNLYIGGSSVFATSGHANPTYTIVQLALRLADHLHARLRAETRSVRSPRRRDGEATAASRFR